MCLLFAFDLAHATDVACAIDVFRMEVDSFDLQQQQLFASGCAQGV